MLQIDGSTTLTMTNFGTKGFMTLEPNNSTQEEQISFTGITQNANGTATLTGVKTVLFIDPYTESSGTAKAHTGGSKAIVSNTAGFYNSLTAKDDDETVTGLWAFPSGSNNPTIGTTYIAPTAAIQIASKGYVDAVAGGIAVTNQILTSGTAGENLTAGFVVYQKTSDGKWYKVLANDTSTFQQLELGIAQSTVSSAASVNILIRGVDSNQSGLVAGTAYYATDAGGLPSATPGTNTVFVGYGTTTATNLLVDFRSIDIPYHGEKLALVGTSGTPGTSNKYVTSDDVSAAGVSGKIIRATGTAIPTLSGINLISTAITGIFITGQTAGDIIVKNNGNGWTRVAAVTGKVPIGTIVSPGVAFQTVPKYSSVTAQRQGDTTSGSQTIAHGLGTTPRKTTISAIKRVGNNIISQSFGTYIGTTTSTIYLSGDTSGTGDVSSTNIVLILENSSSNQQVATITVDATNVNLTWTKSGTTGAPNINLLVETES